MENPGVGPCTYHTTAVWASRCWPHGKGCATLPEMTSPRCSLGWPDTPGAQSLTSSPPWPGPEPGFLLGSLLIPSKSLKACSPPSAPPWPVQPPLLGVAAYIGLACTNAKLHTKASANLGGWPVPPPAQLKLAADLSPAQEGSSQENLTRFSNL